MPSQRVQVDGERGDQRLSFAGFHFRDLAAVQNDAADQLHVEVAHVEHAAAALADHGEGFREQVVERGALGELLPELDGLVGQFLVGQLLDTAARSSLMASTMGRIALSSRSFLVPKILAMTVSRIM